MQLLWQKKQHLEGRLFAHEHPACASSWQLPDVQRVQAMDGVMMVVFDQCMVGLKSKVHGKAMRKRTRRMTNAPRIVAQSSGLLCDRCHQHQTIQGSEGGMKRSVWPHIYPPPMVARLAAGVNESIG